MRREHKGEELGAVTHLGDGHRRERDQERFHQETPDRAVATKRQGPPSLVPEDLPLVSPCSKASYATGFHPSVLTYDPVRAGRLLPKGGKACSKYCVGRQWSREL